MGLKETRSEAVGAGSWSLLGSDQKVQSTPSRHGWTNDVAIVHPWSIGYKITLTIRVNNL